METDRELLRLAALAAGLEVQDYAPGLGFWIDDEGEWNPLTDDGDALRLAVKLNIQMTPRTDGKSEAAHLAYFIEDNKGDPYAATRRAIVRAAAEIGRAKEQSK